MIIFVIFKKSDLDHEKLADEPYLDEFINPVDKQIAAMFQMTSAASLGSEQHATSNYNHNHKKNSDSSSNTEDDDEDDEDDDDENVADKERDDKSQSHNQHDLEIKSFSYSNSKKLLNNSHMDSMSLDASSSSVSSKIGIRRKT